VVFAESETSAGAAMAEVAAYAVTAPGRPPVSPAGSMKADHLMWALGLSAAALSWLAHRASWCATLVPAARRLVVRRTSPAGEDVTQAV
jgi:hypothetical protein